MLFVFLIPSFEKSFRAVSHYFPSGLLFGWLAAPLFWFLVFLALTGRDLVSDSLRAPLHESLLFTLLDAPVIPLDFFSYSLLD